MKKSSIVICLLLIMFPFFAYAESFCQKVNVRGVWSAPQLAVSMNKLLKAKGVTYKTSAKEMTNVISGYCKKNPYSTEDDAINFLNIMADTLAAAEKM
jgi:hypothetical protein